MTCQPTAAGKAEDTGLRGSVYAPGYPKNGFWGVHKASRAH